MAYPSDQLLLYIDISAFSSLLMIPIVIPGCSAPEKVLFRPNSTIDRFFKEFDELTRSISLKSIFFVSSVYLLFNIFHLIILTRPSMRSLIVSKEMILIAICGVLTGFMGVFKSVAEIVYHEMYCALPFSYQVLTLMHFLIFQVVNQVTLWEIVYITFIRATVILDVRHGMKTDKLKYRMRGFIYTFFTIFVVNHIIRIAFHRIEENIDNDLHGLKECPADKIYKVTAVAGNCLRRILLTIAGLTSLIIPIFILFVLSIFLVFELRASSSITTTSKHSSNRHSTAAQALLLFLGFYVLAEIPYAVLFSVGLYNPADFEQLDEYVYSQVDIFIYVNMCLGILVYCLMSSQYRTTVLTTFWRKKQVSVVDKSSRVS